MIINYKSAGMVSLTVSACMVRLVYIRIIHKIIMKQVKEYMESCSLVGVKYIAEEGRHWTERVLWIILVFLRYTDSG
jgi:hypothetical protein